MQMSFILVCDIKNYYEYSLLLSRKSITCIDTRNIRIHNNSIYVDKKKTSVIETINSLNNIEMEILYLFYFHGKVCAGEIAKITNLSKEKIYYRVNRIKVKLGMKKQPGNYQTLLRAFLIKQLRLNIDSLITHNFITIILLSL